MAQLYTRNGYLFGEATSAMQKSIRRGLTDEALYWAHEIAANFGGYIWRRLSVIAVEDVGIATPDVLLELPRMARDGSKQVGLLARAVRLLSDAPAKTRLADRCMCRVYEWEFGHRPMLRLTGDELSSDLLEALEQRDEDRALDLAVSMEPDERRLWSTLSAACSAVLDEYPLAKRVLPEMRWAWDVYVKNKPRGWESNMFFATVVSLLCRRLELRGHTAAAMDDAYVHQFDSREIPEYALDIHTQRGKRMGRDIEYFLTSGVQVSPADLFAPDYLDRYELVCREWWEQKTGKKAKPPIPPPNPLDPVQKELF